MLSKRTGEILTINNLQFDALDLGRTDQISNKHFLNKGEQSLDRRLDLLSPVILSTYFRIL